MKTDEFINKLKQCGFKVSQYNDDYLEVSKHGWSRQVKTKALPTSGLQWTVADEATFSNLFLKYTQTPIKDRFPENKYYLVAHPKALEEMYSSHFKYVSEIYDSYQGFGFRYGPAKKFSESELKDIEQSFPILAEAIETMKEKVKDDETN